MDMQFHPKVVGQDSPATSVSSESSPSEGSGQFPVSQAMQPIPVVRVLSPTGIEYVFLTITLFTSATALIAVLVSLVNAKIDFAVLAFPAAALVITLPIFAFFFLRLKKMEVHRPEQKLDPSKRRSTQFTQIVAFIVCLFTIIGFVFDIFSKIGGQSGPSIGKAALDALSVLIVAGGILAYYFHDEHKLPR
jgi:amino acid transporter